MPHRIHAPSPFWTRIYTEVAAIKESSSVEERQGFQDDAEARLTAAGILKISDIPYTLQNHERQRLDVYLPKTPPTGSVRRPLIVWIHGGSWERGSKAFGPARGAVADGYTVANLAYRYSSDAPFPAQLEDCKAAIRWLRSNGAQFHIDAQRIGVWGGSAGGHLASLLGVTGHVRDFDRGENLAESSRVQCVVNWFGPSDFFQYGVPHWAPLDTSDTAISRLLGGLPPEVPEKARQASPVHQITPDAAPFITFHGDADPLVPLQQSSLLHQRLLQARVESTLHILKGAGHGGPEFNTPEVLEKIAAFFGRHLMDSAWNGKQAGN